MKLDKDLAELDRIDVAANTAHGLEAHEKADDRFHKVARASRTVWLAARVRSL